MKNFLLFLGLMVAAHSQAQMANSTRDLLNNTAGNRAGGGGINSNMIMYGIPLPPGGIQGSFYLDSTFAQGKFSMNSDTAIYTDIPARLNLKDYSVEIKTKEGLRIVDAYRIKFFVLDNNNGESLVFINTKNFKGEAEKISGFMELVQEGKLSLYLYHRVYVRPSTYNEALQAGDRDAKIFKQQDYYVVANNEASKISASKKNILALFEGDKKSKVERYFSDKAPNMKNKADLAQLFSFANSL